MLNPCWTVSSILALSCWTFSSISAQNHTFQRKITGVHFNNNVTHRHQQRYRPPITNVPALIGYLGYDLGADSIYELSFPIFWHFMRFDATFIIAEKLLVFQQLFSIFDMLNICLLFARFCWTLSKTSGEYCWFFSSYSAFSTCWISACFLLVFVESWKK